jgi:hypothetical protein
MEKGFRALPSIVFHCALFVPLTEMAAIHCCTAPNSTGRYAESGKFFKQDKTTAAKATFSPAKGSLSTESQLRIDTNEHVLSA